MRNALTAILVPLLLCSCASSTPQQGMPQNAEDNGMHGMTINTSLPRGSFAATQEGVFSGDVTVRGYAETVTVDEPFCTQNCERYQYVFFHVMEIGNEALGDFLPLQEGNAYAGPGYIGLGCIERDSIEYQNHSDSRGMQAFSLHSDLSAAILNSSKQAPLTLHLIKLPLTGGTEAPACYSHFTSIELAS